MAMHDFHVVYTTVNIPEGVLTADMAHAEAIFRSLTEWGTQALIHDALAEGLTIDIASIKAEIVNWTGGPRVLFTANGKEITT